MRRPLPILLTSLFALGLGAPASAQANCGCTPGFWKTHPELWDGQGGDDLTASIKTFQIFNTVMGVDPATSGQPDSVTLLKAAHTMGGGVNALTRHAAAALASADALPCYPNAIAGVVAIYRDGVDADPGPLTVETAKDLLAQGNEAGCPVPESYCPGEPGTCPCGNFSVSGGCSNSTGAGGLLVASGVGAIITDDLVLTATQLPPNESCLFLAAQDQWALPFWDGTLCVGGPTTKIIRYYPILNSGPGGTVSIGPGLVNHSCNVLGPPADTCIDSGETWNFQLYFRDLSGLCGTGANTTNAIAVTFY